MKTIVLVFCLSCICVLAQVPPPPVTNAHNLDIDALARQAARQAAAAQTNSTNTITVTPLPVVAVPVTPTPAYAPVVVTPAVPVPTPTPGVTVTTVPVVAAPLVAVPAATLPAKTVPVVTAPVLPAALSNRLHRPIPLPPGFNPMRPPGVAAATSKPTTTTAMPLPPPGGFAPVMPVKRVEPEPADVEIKWDVTPLELVLDFYAKLVNRTILQATLPQMTFNLKTQSPLTRTEAIQALDSVLAMNGITMIPVGEKFVKAVQVAEAGKQAAPFSTNDETQLPETDQYVTHIVQLKYAKTADVMPALLPLEQIPTSVIPLDNIGILIIRDYAANVKRMLELIRQIDVTVPTEFESEVIPIKFGKASDIASALSSLGAGGGTSIGSGARTSGTGARTGGLGGIGGIGGGGYGGTSGIGNTIGGVSTTPGGLGGSRPQGSSFAQRVGNLINKAAGSGEFQVFGQTKIIADERSNSLLVFANKQDMAMIKDIIKKLDFVLPQVLIEAIIMEVTLDKGMSTGVSYLQNDVTQGGNYFRGIGGVQNGTLLNPGSFVNTGTNLAALPSGLSYFANFGDDFQATATAVANDSRINVLSRPRIQTSHGVPASLQVGDTVPEVTGTYFGGINGQASSQYQQTFVGIDLEVTPLINPDGLVVMDIVQDVEQLGPTTLIDNNQVPTTSKRTASATVAVRDRDTIILGGMISDSKNTSHSGVPLLKDIPGLGILFRSSSDDHKRVELIVLIHPTVLPNPEDAAIVAAHERAKLPAIKAAEAESRRDEIRRLKEADKIQIPPIRE